MAPCRSGWSSGSTCPGAERPVVGTGKRGSALGGQCVEPAPGGLSGEGEGLHPGGQAPGERDDRASDPILGEVVQRQVGQAGVGDPHDAAVAHELGEAPRGHPAG